MRDLPRPGENTPEAEYLYSIMDLRGSGEGILWKLEEPSEKEHMDGWVERTIGYEDKNGESYLFGYIVWGKIRKYEPEWMSWGYRDPNQIYPLLDRRGWIASHDKDSWLSTKRIRGKLMPVLHLTAAALLNDVTDEELDQINGYK